MRLATRSIALLGLYFLPVAVCVAQAQPVQRPQQSAQQTPIQQQVRNPFKLNKVEQAFLNQVLDAWETESDKVKTFSCKFTKHVYNNLGPAANIAFQKQDGEISYQNPDKGSFKINKTMQWQPAPVAPGQNVAAVKQPPQGKYVEMLEVVGEHWVCDGKKVYEFRPQAKQLAITDIPPEMQGEEIVNGPLPFLFGAKADDLKKRYWLRIHANPDPNIIHIVALPKTRADAANYRAVEIMLNRQRLLPTAMQVHPPGVPGGVNERAVYQFDMASAAVNSRVDRFWNMIFSAPRKPLGWTVVDGNAAHRQAAGQAPAARR